jgi:hypothetical protein
MKANLARQLTDLASDQKPRGHGDKSDRKSEAAIVAPTMPEAAKAAGVSETTLWHWLQRDDFRKKSRRLRKEQTGVTDDEFAVGASLGLSSTTRRLDFLSLSLLV